MVDGLRGVNPRAKPYAICQEPGILKCPYRKDGLRRAILKELGL